MTEPIAPRPRQVTLAAWLIMLGSAVVVLSVFERISGLQSLQTQEAVQQFLSTPPGDGLGLEVQGVLDILRALAMVAGGCAAAAGVLGYQVLRRSRSARVALSVLAAPLFVTGIAAGGFMSSLVVAAAVMLWFQPSRDWFNGVTREPTREREKAREDVPPAGPSAPRGFPGFGAAPSTGADPSAGPTAGAAAGAGKSAYGAIPAKGDAAGPRPAAVTWACALTWVFATLAVVVMGASIAVIAADPGLVFDELNRQNPDLVAQGVSERLLTNLTYVMGGLVIVWSLAAAALAYLTFRGVGWARVGLVVSASLAAAVCLVVAATGQFLLVPALAACVVTLALLVRPDIRAWFR